MPTESIFERFRSPGGTQVGTEGATLASATTVAPTHRIHVVSGTTEITTITVPYTGFEGDIVFIPSGIFTLATGGNVGLAATAVVGKAMTLTYIKSTALWYPSYVA